MAKSYLNRILTTLTPEIDAGTSMVVLEPSCCSVFRDELNGLMPDLPRAHRLMEQTFTLAEFLEKKADKYAPPQLSGKAIVQGHCHHKAIMRLKEEEKVMDKLGLDYEILQSGCCGMAGSFGYESDKYDVSIKAGERVLLPEVRKAGLSTFIVADGFSCKEQIEQQTNRQALHLAEVISIAMKEGPYGRGGTYPEDHSVRPRLEQQRRSTRRAGLITASTIAIVAVIGVLWKRRKKL